MATTAFNPDNFVEAVREVVGDSQNVGLHVPDISSLEHEYVSQCLDSTFVSSVGPFVTQFEIEFANFVGSRFAIAVSNGTSALQVALKLAGVKAGDEVIVPTLSFIATANAVSHLGAIPHFVDSSLDNLGIDPESLREMLSSFIATAKGLTNPKTGRNVSAVVPMHTIGHPAEIFQILEVCNEFGIPVVEDAAESLGSYFGEKHTGTFGKLGVFSFNGNKILTTGGGGMIVTDDPDLAYQAKHLTTTAKLQHEWEFSHDQVAWNYRLPNLNAALGVAQMKRLPTFLSEKREIARAYESQINQFSGVHFISEPKGTHSNYWLCSIMLDSNSEFQRDDYLRQINKDGIQCRPLWNLLSQQKMYVDAPSGPINNAKSIVSRTISLPSSPQLARNFRVTQND